MGEAEARPATWRSLLADREYRSLWGAQAGSVVGDQLGRVALALLVLDRTGSGALTAVVYSLTYLPWLIGGPLLGGLADRFPRRTVMIICNLGSAGMIALMTIPGVPLPVLTALLFIAVLLESPFNAARSALIADVLPDDRYVLANALGNITNQTGQVVGFAVGGLVVNAIGVRSGLLLDVGTFLLSALILLLGTRARPAAAPSNGHGGFADWWGRISGGARLVFGDARLRTLLLLSWLAMFYVIPEGLAAPYGKQLHANPFGVGLLFAAQPAGVVIGGIVLSRLIRPARRIALLVPLSALACAPMIALGLHPNLAISLALLALGGAGASYQLVANATYVQNVTPNRRGQAYGLAVAGLTAGQGLGIFGAGAIAGAFHLQPSAVIAGAGVVGLLAVLAISSAGRALVASPVARGALNPRP